MKQYVDLLRDVLLNGERRDDRTGTGTLAVFGRQIRFNLRRGFPAVTTKKLAWRAVVGELLWFLEGSCDERRLAEITHGTRDGVVTIWTPNAHAPYWTPKAQFAGDLGRVYGVQWRTWRATDGSVVDQVARLVEGLRTDPHGRRHILTAWNPAEIEQMALPPCHVLCQFYVGGDKSLSCHLYQRSQDVFLGAPFNYASYALLTHLIARVCGLGVGDLVISTGDTHIYLDHLAQVREQITRSPYPLPDLAIAEHVSGLEPLSVDDFTLVNYRHHPPLKGRMSV